MRYRDSFLAESFAKEIKIRRLERQADLKTLDYGPKKLVEKALAPKREKPDLNKPLPELPSAKAYRKEVANARAGLAARGVPDLVAGLWAHAAVRLQHGVTPEIAGRNIVEKAERAAARQRIAAKSFDTESDLTRKSSEPMKLEKSRPSTDRGRDRQKTVLNDRGERSRSDSRGR